MMKNIFCLLFIAITTLTLPINSWAADKPTVFVSILPQKFFIEKLMGNDAVQVEVMVSPGANPHTYEPKPSQMRALSTAKAYFSIGVPFENASLEKLLSMNKGIMHIAMDAGVARRAMPEGHHHHGEDHAHGHDDSSDPHTWLSPQLVLQQLDTATIALKELFPEKSSSIETHRQEFVAEIQTLQAEISSTLSGKEGLPFLVFHPSWGYFADEFSLHQISVEIEGKEPKPSQIAQLIMICQSEDIHVIFAQPQFSTKSAELIASEIKGQVILIDPLAEDWLANMLFVAEQFEKALQQ